MNGIGMCGRVLCLGLLGLAGTLPAQEASTASADMGYDPYRMPARELELSIGDDFFLCMVGDCILSRPLTQLGDPNLQGVLDRLRAADLTFGNLETNILDSRTFTGCVQAEYDDFCLISAPAVAADLKDMGFDLVARANNHALDWGIQGMRETSCWLDRAGLVYAGCGETAAQARAPRYVETGKGRVALVAVASEFPPVARAMDSWRQAPGRPGIATLRRETVTVLSPRSMRALCWARDVMAVDVRDPAAAEQLLAQGAGVLDYELPLTFRLGRVPCVLGETAGVRHRIHAEDLRDTLWNVRLGKQHADLLIVSHHCHDGDLASGDPVDYQRDLAHQVVDAGADVYVAQGTHRLMSLEVYRGKPIFYGLGNFFWSDIQEPVCADIYDRHADKLRTADLDSNQATDADLNALLNAASFAGVDGINPVFESAFVECRFARGRISQIRVIPLDLGYGKRLTRSGIPRWACAATGRRILDRLQAGCASLGTHLRIKNGIGLVELESQGVQAAGSGIEGHDSGRATVGTQNKEKPK